MLTVGSELELRNVHKENASLAAGVSEKVDELSEEFEKKVHEEELNLESSP